MERNNNQVLNEISSCTNNRLKGLRKRVLCLFLTLMISTVVCFCLKLYVRKVIEVPYTIVLRKAIGGLEALTPSGEFVSYVKLSLIAGLIISSPVIFYHLCILIISGSYTEKKSFVRFLTCCSTALLILGVMYSIFIIAPLYLGFFANFNTNMPRVSFVVSFEAYVSFITFLILSFGVSFLTPVILLVLRTKGLIPMGLLSKLRIFVLLGIIIMAIATMPDFVSQVALVIPLYLLYEVGILVCYFADKSENGNKGN